MLNCGRYDGGGQYLQHNCQEFTTTCLKNSEMLEESLPAAAPAILEGKPPEWPTNFQQFATCPSSQARAHTMAEMTVDFSNTCEEVMSEIQARAGSAANGGSWVDPHNMGHYSIIATEGNVLKVQRYTKKYRYKDIITFALYTNGSGCQLNACSVSQGNSNDDGGTNMCNMGDLFCNNSVKNDQNGASCKSVKYNLSYTVPMLNCGRYDGGGQYLQHNCQDFTTACLKNTALEAPQHVLRYLFN